MFRPIEVFEKLLSIHLLSSFEFQLRILSFQIVEWPPGIPYSAPQSLFKNHVVSIHEGRQVLPAIDTIISDQRLLPIELELFSVISSGVEIHEKIELLPQRGDHGSPCMCPAPPEPTSRVAVPLPVRSVLASRVSGVPIESKCFVTKSAGSSPADATQTRLRTASATPVN